MVNIYVIYVLMFAASDTLPAPAVLTATDRDVRIIRYQDSVETRARALDHLFDGDSVITGDGQATVLFLTGKFTVIGRHEAVLLTLLDANTARSTRADQSVIHLDMKTFGRLFDRSLEAEIPDLEKTRSAPRDTLGLTIYGPGNTAVRTPRPDMLWGSYPGANWYGVTVEHRGRVVQNIATTDTFLCYPEQHDSLSAGSYVLRVCAFHNNDSLCSHECFFHVLAEGDIDAIDRSVEEIKHTCPEPYTGLLLTAMVYEKHGLVTEAIDAYRDLLQQNPVPFVYRVLAKLYYTLGIPDIARSYHDAYRSFAPEP
jgi:hypothetical protein